MSEVHVIPDHLTTWRVFDTGAPAPVSEHTSATDAEIAAREHAEANGADRVVVYDRYHRTYDAPASPVGLRARAMHTRARQLDAVREQTRRLVRASYFGAR